MAGQVGRRSGRKPAGQGAETELIEECRGVDQHVAVRAEPGEEVDLVDEGGSWTIRASGSTTGSRVRIGLVVDPAVGDHRCPHPLRAEARERLGVPALVERGDRQELGRCYDPLAAPAMEAHPNAAPAWLLRVRIEPKVPGARVAQVT